MGGREPGAVGDLGRTVPSLGRKGICQWGGREAGATALPVESGSDRDGSLGRNGVRGGGEHGAEGSIGRRGGSMGRPKGVWGRNGAHEYGAIGRKGSGAELEGSMGPGRKGAWGGGELEAEGGVWRKRTRARGGKGGAWARGPGGREPGHCDGVHSSRAPGRERGRSSGVLIINESEIVGGGNSRSPGGSGRGAP